MAKLAQEISAENEVKVLSDILMVKALVLDIQDNVKKLREEIKLMKFNMQTYQQMKK